ncbi:MAG TPA: acylphosphatase [Candidatus Saccharimonadales bacterium]|nr:acylphosphatase [Candidatus Saccharimonadales bacterium]
MKVRARVVVSGRVQGVFFRVQTRKTALANHLSGWVRNLSNGQVEAVFEGEKHDVEIALDFCQHGPVGAHVEGLDVTWEVWKGEFSDFQIF